MSRRKRDSVLAEKIQNEQKKLIVAITAVETETEESLSKVASLLANGVDPSARDYNRWLYYSSMNYYSPLHYASRKGKIKTMELLLKYKANPNAKDRYYVTPLHLAAEHGYEQCVKRLIEAGAVIDAKTRYLADYQTQTSGTGPVTGLSNATVSKHAALPYKGGTTPLHLAAAGNHIASVECLMLEGADYNAVNCKGETSLYIAAAKGFPDCVLMQLHSAHSVPILSIPTNTDDTPLHQCLRRGETMRECVKMLIQHGSDVSFSNKDDQTPIHVALRHQWDDDIIKLLVLEGYNMDFDRKSRSFDNDGRQRFGEDPYNRPTISAKNPLELVIFGEGGVQNSSESTVKRNKDLAVFFIKVGASRDLLDILAAELRSKDPAGPILNAVMDSFAYLPPLKDVLSREKRHRFSFPGVGYRQFRCAERKKKEADYLSRAKEVPSLQHLCRIAVRSIMQQQVRKVTRLPLPTNVKEYILLELKIPESPV